ncbi:MAG: hypothetical protein BIFFINMI_04090 [Phycisphaerae bacterium]|nr:hypothetical protein [Phycisphaerae bacterium]
MKRKLLIYAVSLGVVLAGFGLVLYKFVLRDESGSKRTADSGVSVFNGADDVSSVKASPLTENVAIGPGKDINWPFYETDSKTGRSRNVGRLKATECKPIPDEQGRYSVTQPRIRLESRKGNQIYLEADSAVIAGNAGAKPGQLNPKRGRLHGNVVLKIDRNTSDNKAPMDQRNDDTIRFFFTADDNHDGTDDAEVDFDIPDNLIQSAARLRMEMKEADMEVTGMSLRWDPVSKVITRLRLNTQSELASADPLPKAWMLVRAGMLGRNGAGFGLAGPQPAPAAAPVQTVSTTQTPAAPATTPKPAAAPRPQDVQTYVATFLKDVHVIQGYDPNDKTRDAPDSKPRFPMLTSDRQIQVVFDFAQTDEEKAADTKKAGPSGSQPTAIGQAPTPPAAAVAAGVDPNAIRITWEGMLDMIPLDRSTEAGRIITGQRRQLIATGNNVVLTQPDGQMAQAREVRYDTETQTARLIGSDAAPAILTRADGQTVKAREIVYDQRNNRAKVLGSGEMITNADRTGATVNTETMPTGNPLVLQNDKSVLISWNQLVEIELMGPPIRQVAGDGPTTRPDKGPLGTDRDYIRMATFSGKVRMMQLKQYEIEAHNITVYFKTPVAGSVQPNQIDYVEAQGEQSPGKKFESQVRIRMLRETQQSDILCDRLTLNMKLMPDGTTAPDKAIATGNVKANQSGAIIEAERMELSFERIAPEPDEGSRTDLGSQYRPVEARAFGKHVVIRDPKRQLMATGDHVYSLVGSNKLTLHGQPAEIDMAGRRLTGALIELSEENQSLRVVGAGTLAFVSERDLTGGPLDKPVPVTADWKLGMSYAGDTAELRGDVRAVSGTSRIEADILRIGFQDKPPPDKVRGPAPPATGAAAAVSSMAMGAPTTQPADSAPEAQLAGRVADDASGSGPTTRPDNPDLTPADRMVAQLSTKQLKNVAAERNVVVVTSQTDPKDGRLLTRMRIEAEQLLFDAATGQVDANGRGRLSIEDYRPPDKAPAEKAEPAAAPLGGDAQAARPSQTVFAWARTMRFAPEQLLASFAGSVVMAYRGPKGLNVDERGGIQVLHDVPVTRLTSDTLLIEFVGQPKSADTPSGGLTAQSGRIRDIKNVTANGQVGLQEGGRSMFGQQLVFDRVGDTITVKGNRTQRAHLYDTGAAGSALQDVTASTILWNRKTNEIRTQDSTFSGSGPNG